MKAILLFLTLTLVLFSCDNRKREISRLVKEWKNKEILFPENLDAKIYGRDTFCPDIWNARYKILNYTDTSGCTECKMHLYDWKLLKQQTDSLGLDVSYIFVAWVHQYDELETLQSINKCDIPFYYDYEGQMMQLNHFPDHDGFQTFLLDSANRVILIGNPVTSTAIRELYFATLREAEAELQSEKRKVKSEK